MARTHRHTHTHTPRGREAEKHRGVSRDINLSTFPTQENNNSASTPKKT